MNVMYCNIVFLRSKISTSKMYYLFYMRTSMRVTLTVNILTNVAHRVGKTKKGRVIHGLAVYLCKNYSLSIPVAKDLSIT